MLDDRMNAATPFSPSEVQRKIECRPHECHAENSDQRRRARKALRGQSEAVAFLTKQIVPRRRDVLETKQRREMRTVTYRIDRAFEDDTGGRPFNRYDGDGFLRWGVGVGSAHNAENVSSLTIPPRCRGHPLFSAVDDPVVALQLSDGAHALAWGWRSGIGTAARFGRAKRCQWGSTLLQKRVEQSADLFRPASEQNRQQTQHCPQHRQGDASIYAVELLGDDGHVDQASVVAARRNWNALPQKSRRHHRLVDGLGRTKSLLRSGQQLSSPCARDYVRSEHSGFELERVLT